MENRGGIYQKCLKHSIGDIERDGNNLFVKDLPVQGEAPIAAASPCVSSPYLNGKCKNSIFNFLKTIKIV